MNKSFVPAFALLCLGIGASCARGANESPDLANESPDLANKSPDVASESPAVAIESRDLARLESFLGNYYQRLHLEGDPPIRVAYDVAATDLNADDVDELLVYLRSDYFCGTSGCNLLILARRGEAFRVVTEMSVAKPPIRVLDTRSNGWRNLTVTRRAAASSSRWKWSSLLMGPAIRGTPPCRPREGWKARQAARF